MNNSDKLRVGILGATGMVGQQYIKLLENHPWFEVRHVVASEKSAGRSYADAVNGRWHMPTKIPEDVKDLNVYTIDDIDSAAMNCDFVFSALDSDIAKVYEEKYADAGIPVVSNSSAHRWTDDIPMLIPEINSSHLDIITIQQKNHGWKKGFIVVKPNCSLQSYLTPLYALDKKFGLDKVIVTTMQAVSGAGHPGVSSFDIIDNIIPYIKGEEDKTEKEPLKILGIISGNRIIADNRISISAHCNRVPVIDGHMACVSFSLKKIATKEEIIECWENFNNNHTIHDLKLPSSPECAITYSYEPDRPQTRIDRDNDKGMTVNVGRLRECNVLQWKFVALSHNTIRGAAGGGILNAELLKEKGFFN